MDDGGLKHLDRVRGLIFKPALIVAGVGLVVGAVGWLMGRDGSGALDDGVMTAAGVATGAGVMIALFAWAGHRVGRALPDASAGSRRDREQATRLWQLTMMPMATLILSALAMRAAERLVHGSAERLDWLLAANAALYAIIVPMMVMNWDAQARKLKRYLEDELVRTIQARAVTAAFFVLLGGVCGLYLVGLWKADWAVIGMPALLWATSATASFRFVMLSRSYDG